MTWDPYPPLPLGAVRDLLGITRALYRAALMDEPRDAERLQALDRIGRMFQAVLGAAHAHRGTAPHVEAWAAAECATRALGDIVGESTLLGPVIAATARRLSRPGSMS